MEKMILSLKNIYMLLMTEDFPIYSEGVISRSDRRGLTMLRFWQGQIAEEFRSLPRGKMLWRNDGKRNRYTSYLCNRSAEIKTYDEYAQELASQVNVSSLRNQIGRFTDFLSARKYRHDILLRRIRELMRLTEAEDPRVTREIAEQLLKAADWQPNGAQGSLFQAAYLLTLLTLYAAAGEAMDDAAMAVLRSGEYGIEEMWSLFTQPEESGDKLVSFLTAHSGLLQDNPLPPYRFFGREEELFNLKEIAVSGRRCLISGMGGMGKTELLRQLIRICENEKTLDKIAVVPYEGGIVESMARCFPGNQRQSQEESFHTALFRLKEESGQSRVLLLIDNLTKGPEENPELKELSDLPCGIIITSRRTALEGYETFNLKPPAVGTGALIFRDNYGRPLSREDRAALEQLLQNEALCHPLTLRLMARAAKSRGWTVAELKTQLEKQETSLSWREEERTERLGRVYRQLYSTLRLPEECRPIAELFTLLPRDSYDAEFLREWFPAVVDYSAGEKLDALTEGGWLDKDGSGYAMHPLIAQCLRRTVITEDKLTPALDRVREYLSGLRMADYTDTGDKDRTRLCRIFFRISSCLTGSISCQWLTALTVAMISLDATQQFSTEALQLLARLEKRCPEMDEGTRIHCLIARCNWLSAPEGECAAVYERQKACRTVPELLYRDFCRMAAYSAAYQNGNYALAESLLKETLATETEPIPRTDIYTILVDSLSFLGKREEALAYCKEGLALAKSQTDIVESFVCGLLSRTCQLYILLGRKELAAELAPEMEERMSRTSELVCRYHLATGLGAYAGATEDYEKALEYESLCLALVELRVGRTTDYYITMASVAVKLYRLKRYEEAVARYKEALEHMRQGGFDFWIQNICNNISLAYLELKMPEKALEYLEEALEITRTMGGLDLGLTQRARAMAFEQLGDREQEYACLEEACPLLEAGWGPENPRAAAARKRFEELKQYLLRPDEKAVEK